MLRKIIVFVFAAAMLTACGNDDQQAETLDTPKTSKVRTVTVEKTSTASSRSFTATVSSEKTAFIIPKVVGYVEQILVSPGQKIEKGQLLVTIKSGELEEKYAFAQSSRKEAEIGLKMAQAQLVQAKSQYDLAEKTYNRFSNLIKNNSVSRQEYDQVEASYDLAKQALNIAEERVEQARLKQQQADSMLNEVKTYLSYTQIKAPFDGVVLEQNMDAGNLAAPGNPILKIGNTATVIYTYISQSLIKDITTGMEALVSIESLNEEYDSEVLEISPDVDVFTGNFKVKLMGCEKLYPGMFAKVRFVTGSEEVITIPESAVVKRGQLTIVFVNDRGRADMRVVKTGREFDGMVEILSGLEEGEQIVADNAKLLKSGDILEAE